GLIHHDLLQASLDTRDADVRDAIREILARAEGRRPHLRTLAGSGDWVREQCLRIAREHPQPEPFRARLTGFLAALDLLRCTPEGVLRRSKGLARLHALDDPGRAHWRAAAQAWTRTLAEPALPLEAKQAVHHALEDVQEGSLAHADLLRRQALREVEAGRRTEALRLLEAARPRFDGTAGGAFLQKIREAFAP
ncbi:MAG TPA: hypothetical protein VEJ18_19565, partial [Planctomycetota bacterium]|nr:hypothetical protein [Planctomycetota bacterium]